MLTAATWTNSCKGVRHGTSHLPAALYREEAQGAEVGQLMIRWRWWGDDARWFIYLQLWSANGGAAAAEWAAR